MPWDPDRYNQFQRERDMPFDDLARLIDVREGLRVIDLGCGTGELTRRLADLLPGSDVLGIDSSPEMLVRAAAYARPGLRFEQAAIESVRGEWDLIFSHAALQWVGDHPALIPRLFDSVSPGGQLVAQLPSNHDNLNHTQIRTIARTEPFRSALGGWVRQFPVLSIEAYAQLLYECGGQAITVFEKVYTHVLESADALADRTSGTALVPYFERLPDDHLRDLFMEQYRAALREHYPSGPVFYPFRRILFAATRV